MASRTTETKRAILCLLTPSLPAHTHTYMIHTHTHIHSHSTRLSSALHKSAITFQTRVIDLRAGEVLVSFQASSSSLSAIRDPTDTRQADTHMQMNHFKICRKAEKEGEREGERGRLPPCIFSFLPSLIPGRISCAIHRQEVQGSLIYIPAFSSPPHTHTLGFSLHINSPTPLSNTSSMLLFFFFNDTKHTRAYETLQNSK